MTRKVLIAIVSILVFAAILSAVVWNVQKRERQKQAEQEGQEMMESQEKGQARKQEEQENTVEEYEEKSIDFQNCEVGTASIDIKKARRYDIFGGEEFETFVCGHKEIRQEQIPFSDKNEKQENVYFRITEFADEKFKEAILKGIESGNSINKKDGDKLYLNLGCLKNEGISGIVHDENGLEGKYLGEETEKIVLNSSANNQVALMLSFGLHEGGGCICCNLVHDVAVIK